MYRAFNVTCGDQILAAAGDCIAAGKQQADYNSQQVRDGLEKFVRAGKINGSALQSHWFPKVDADVFISHASADQDAALALAGLLTGYGIASFIDSCVWGDSDDLLREIDEKFCRKSENSYSYEKRNGTTSHVHMMLATALAEMMDRAEAVFFLSSPASVTIADSIRAVGSPWIYHELMLTTLLRRHPLETYRGIVKKGQAEILLERRDQLPFLYTPSFDSLTQIDLDDLAAWLQEAEKNETGFALDALYKTKP